MIAVIGGTTEAMIAPVIAGAVDLMKIKDVLESERVLQRCLAVVGGETLGKEDVFPVDAPDHHVCVADIYSEKHAVPPYCELCKLRLVMP